MNIIFSCCNPKLVMSNYIYIKSSLTVGQCYSPHASKPLSDKVRLYCCHMLKKNAYFQKTRSNCSCQIKTFTYFVIMAFLCKRYL